MTTAEHIAQRETVRASLASTHHPDVYGRQPISRTGDHLRPTDEGRVSAVPSRTTPSHGAQLEEAGRGGRAARPTRTCTCGHLAGDHSDGRNRSLTPAPLGLCHVTGCGCREFRAVECGCPVINGVLVEQASCPEHGWENHPVMRRVPGTTRHV